MPFRSLQSDLITKQIESIKKRIEERFPERNLVLVCDELLTVSRETSERAAHIARPLYWVRLGLPIAIIAFLLALDVLYLFFRGQIDQSATLNYADFLEMSDALFNIIVLFPKNHTKPRGRNKELGPGKRELEQARRGFEIECGFFRSE